ncbi:MAG: LptF/LptG family permease [Planctomycetota bacterium]|jgi:lipopolysaccharide export system permease protein
MISERLGILREALPLRTADRYLLRQGAIAWSICALAILGLFVMIDGLSRLERFLNQEESIFVVLVRYFTATIPVYFVNYFGPILTLLATMFAITQLNKGNELIPLRLAGLSTARILAPFFLIAAISTVGMILLQEGVIPNLKDLIRTATAYGSTKDTIRPDDLTDNRNQLVSVDEYLPSEQRGVYVTIESYHREERNSNKIKSRIKAHEIHWKVPDDGGEPYWLLLDGYIQRWDENSRRIPTLGASKEERYSEHFDRYKLKTDIQPVDLESTDAEIQFLSFRELLDQSKRRDLRHLEVKLHMRFAFPLSNFILVLLGVPFVLRGENRSIVIGIALAIGISAVYLIATMYSAELGNREVLPPFFAAWLPVLFFGALGLTMFDSVDSTE